VKILVTGGAGFIGANLCRRLVQNGAEVVVLDDLSTGHAEHLKGLDVDLRVASVLDVELLADACTKVSSIVHLAARPSVPKSIVDPRRSHDANATGTVAVLEAARATGAHLVISSSSSVYGNSPTLPKRESMACSPASPYAVSKLAAESYGLAYQRCYGLPCTVFRFFNVFGPLQDPDHDYAAVVPTFIWAALKGAPIPVFGDGEQTRDFTFVDSVTDVLQQCVARRACYDAPVNLAFGTRCTVNTLIDVLSALLGRRLEVDRRPPRSGEVRHSQAATDSLTTLFPTAMPVPLEEGLSRTIGWMEEKMRDAESLGVSA
jgi:UDP-glucose 4-epimerase